MKNTILSLSLFTFILHLAASAAALPEDWDVELTAQTPQVFTLQRPRGETYELEAVLKRHGKPFEPAITNAFIYWQTNGMENLYWSAPASVSNNVLRATWLPEMDPGATTVRGYIGDPGHLYAAAFQFRFIASPGVTPNELPLPQKVIDFAKVTVLNPPWSGGGGGGGVNTNAVIDIIHETVDGSARMLPPYLHYLEMDDTYPDAAEEYYLSREDGRTDGGCSSVRNGNFLYRNFDYPFDDRAEFVVKMSAGTVPSASSPTGAFTHRFASVGVAQVGTNLTEQIVTSGKWSKWYKALPGAAVDGINENGVVSEINVVDGDPQTSGWHTTGDIHPLAAVRWSLDNGTSAEMVATSLAARIQFPAGWTQNFHYMIADETSTYIVENGTASNVTAVAAKCVMTNFPILTDDYDGMGAERYRLLRGGVNITNAWYTNAYRRETNPPWVSDLRDVLAYTNEIFNAWAAHPKEYFRGKTNNGEPWWQTVHTSIYDLANRVLRVAVQETDDWYTFQVPSSGAKVDAYTKAETDAKLAGKADLSDLYGRLPAVQTYESGPYNIDVFTLFNKFIAVGLGAYFYAPSWSDYRAGSNDELPSYLAGGDWNTSTDPFVRRSDIADKANRPSSSTGGNLASLTADGDLADSGKKPSDFRETTDNTCHKSQLGNVWMCDPPLPEGYEIVRYSDGTGWEPELNGNPMGAGKQDPDNTATTLSWAANEWQGGYAFTATRTTVAKSGEPFVTEGAISTNNPAFSNAVDTIVRSLMPTTLRAYDPVRQCWWNIQPVNGVLTLTVED